MKEWIQAITEYVRASEKDLQDVDLQDVDLQYADLRHANLRFANLRGADLRHANLRYADLRYADLQYANLQDVDLQDANLQGANLQYADLRGANLQDANLQGANLRYADLQGANLQGAKLPHFQIPQEGELIVWKKIRKKLVKLRVPPKAKRTANLVSRKCRAEFVEVLTENVDLTADYGGETRYVTGQVVYPDSYNDDVRVECTNGIHFFLTKEEAEQW